MTEADHDDWGYLNDAGIFEDDFMANYSLAMHIILGYCKGRFVESYNNWCNIFFSRRL